MLADEGRYANAVKPEGPHTEDGRGDDRRSDNVVRFPRDWIGPEEELVPVGPPPRGEDELPASAADFWGEESGALQHALQGPAQGADDEGFAAGRVVPFDRKARRGHWTRRSARRRRVGRTARQARMARGALMGWIDGGGLWRQAVGVRLRARSEAGVPRGRFGRIAVPWTLDATALRERLHAGAGGVRTLPVVGIGVAAIGLGVLATDLLGAGTSHQSRRPIPVAKQAGTTENPTDIPAILAAVSQAHRPAHQPTLWMPTSPVRRPHVPRPRVRAAVAPPRSIHSVPIISRPAYVSQPSSSPPATPVVPPVAGTHSGAGSWGGDGNAGGGSPSGGGDSGSSGGGNGSANGAGASPSGPVGPGAAFGPGRSG